MINNDDHVLDYTGDSGTRARPATILIAVMAALPFLPALAVSPSYYQDEAAILSIPRPITGFSKLAPTHFRMDHSLRRRFCLQLAENSRMSELEFYLPFLHLLRNYEKAAKKASDPHKRIDHVLNSISKFDWAKVGKDVREFFDVITDRSTLSTIASTPYGVRFGWALKCMRVGKAVVISNVENSMAQAYFTSQQELLQNFRVEKLCRYISVNAKGEGFNSLSEVIDLNQAYYKLFSTLLGTKHGSIRLLYAAKVACTTADDHPVEVRIHRGQLAGNQIWSGKFLKWYWQSRLSGAENIVVGERGHSEQVGAGNEERLANMVQLPVDVLRQLGSQRWSTDVCLAFLLAVLTNIMNGLRANKPGLAMHVEFRPGWDTVRFCLVEGADPMEVLTPKFAEKFYSGSM